MARLLEEVPVEAAVEVPLPPLPELVSHEDELLAGVAPHVAVEEAEVREPLPRVPRHLIGQRPLAVDDLVVGEGEDEVLVEGVDQAEGEFVVVVFAVDGVVPHVAERVVHPAHVPLQAEAEPAEPGGA